MWSSFTLKRTKEGTKHDTAGDKVAHSVNKKLSRAATFCFDSDYNEKKKKARWKRNLPNIKKGVVKITNEKFKFEDYKIKEEEEKNDFIPVKPRYTV